MSGKRLISFGIALGVLGALLLTACGGTPSLVSGQHSGAAPVAPEHSPPQSLIWAQLPPLPPAGTAAPAARHAAGWATEGELPLLPAFASAGQFEVRNEAVLLSSDPGGISWEMVAGWYVGQGPLRRLDIDLSAFSGSAWVAVSDYGLGRWHFLGEATEQTSLEVPAEVQPDSQQLFYILFVAYNGTSFKVQGLRTYFDAAEEIVGTISGAVHNPLGQALPGIFIDAVDSTHGNRVAAVTDAQGNYRLVTHTAGEYIVGKSDSDYSYGRLDPLQQTVDVKAGEDQAGIDFVDPDLYLHRGMVLVDGQPTGGVEIIGNFGDSDVRISWPDGSFDFHGSTNELSYEMYAKGPGLVFDGPQVTLPPSQTTAVVLNLHSGLSPSLRGKVTSVFTGLPIADAKITLTDYGAVTLSATSNSAGNYELADIPADPFLPYVVTLEAPADVHLDPVSAKHILVGLQDVSGVNFGVQPHYVVSGTVSDQNGNGVPGIDVKLEIPGQPVQTTNSSGRFAFAGVYPGKYMLTADQFGEHFGLPLTQQIVVSDHDLYVTLP